MITDSKMAGSQLEKWVMEKQMSAITACAARTGAVTVGLCPAQPEYEKQHFVTDQYEIESPKLPDGASFRCAVFVGSA